MMDWNNTTPAATAQHVRARARLNALVQTVIRLELSEQDRLLVRLHWYQGRSIDEIAQLIGTERSFVYRRMERIHRTVYDKLKYAVQFHFDEPFRAEADRMLQHTEPNAFALEALGGIGARLAALRRKRRLGLHEICRATGIPRERLELLERDGRQMTMSELSALTRLLGVGTNELLFGVPDREWAQ